MGVLDAVLADLQYYAQTFDIPNYSMNDMCHLCRASKTNPARYFTDAGPAAGWQGTQYTNQEFHQIMSGSSRGRPPLADIPGLHIKRLFICDLHTVNQGTASHIAANIIWELLTKDWPKTYISSLSV